MTKTPLPFAPVRATAAPDAKHSPFFMGSAAPTREQAAKIFKMGAPANLLTPPPPIDTLYTGYEGIPGALESLLVLGILGSAAYLGITTGMKDGSATKKALAWTAGAGSALLGLLYLGGKTGANDYVGLPAVRVVPA